MRRLLFFFLAAPLTLFSQPLESDSIRGVEFVPHGLLFPPLIANVYEARMGVAWNDGGLRLDIGNSADLLRWRVDERNTLTLGADFFTWTALRRETNFHFPVDAVDYLFGLNVNYRRPLNTDWTLGGRLRFSHISAHLADGSYDKTVGRWRNERLPRVYSREFFDLAAALEWTNCLRAYAGFQYLYHVDPEYLGQWQLQAGLEFAAANVVADWVHPYVAFDIKLRPLYEDSEPSASQSAQVGLKLGHWRGRGVAIFLQAYAGSSYHGEYFDLEDSFIGPGFTVDF